MCQHKALEKNNTYNLSFSPNSLSNFELFIGEMFHEVYIQISEIWFLVFMVHLLSVYLFMNSILILFQLFYFALSCSCSFGIHPRVYLYLLLYIFSVLNILKSFFIFNFLVLNYVLFSERCYSISLVVLLKSDPRCWISYHDRCLTIDLYSRTSSPMSCAVAAKLHLCFWSWVLPNIPLV